jgi:osmotically-inducible protein OsmY
MKQITIISLLVILAGIPLSAETEASMVAHVVEHELAMLPFYSVFDDLHCRVEGDTVELMGQVSRQSLRTDAEEAINRLDCVRKVVNRIAVLPASARDDRIRLAAFRALSANAELRFLVASTMPSIHIVVVNGVVTLQGSVASSGQSAAAAELLQSVDGVTEVRNRLQIGSS